MARSARCPNCDQELPVNALLGLCPVCLLSQGMDDESLGRSDRDEPVIMGRFSGESSNGRVLQLLETAIGEVRSVLLPDTEDGLDAPVVRPSSPEMRTGRGRYQLLGEIGHGGMGAVFKGRDPDLGRDLAVKILLEEHENVPDLVRRFIEEAQIGGQLQHPGIVPVYELGVFSDQRPYFTMKLVKGRTLATLMRERVGTTHDVPRLLGIFEQVCQTMAYAHARGVIHRDLKPSNIMVGAFGEVQVMDWGLAKVLPKDGPKKEVTAPPADLTVVAPVRGRGESDFSEAGSVPGTPAYMAPEQARGETEAIDRRADVFALGSILCEILTGAPAFSGRSSNEIVRMARRADTAGALARLEQSGADSELLVLARGCLAPVAADRPPDAGAVAGCITAYLTGVQERLRETELSRAAESARAHEAEAKASAERHARRLTGALAATVVLAGVLGGATWGWLELKRMERVREVAARVNSALRDATHLRGLAKGAAVGDLGLWVLAAGAAETASGLLDPSVEPALRKQVDELAALVAVERREAEAAAQTADQDRRLLNRLIDIRSAEADDRGGSITDAAYADAFREAGIDVAALPAEQTAQRIRERPAEVAIALATALDDWAAIRRDRKKDRAGARALSALAGSVDPDPWRLGLRQALDLPDQVARLEALRRLARDAHYETLGPVSLDLLGRALKDAGDQAEAESALRRAQQRHPGDVWINYDLAQSLERLARRDDAIRYYMAARSLRPETAHELAHTLGYKGERDEEIAILEDLRRLRPSSGRHLGCLSRALQMQGRSQEGAAMLEAATAANREAVQKKPGDAYAHFSLAFALFMQGKLDDAVAEYGAAIRIEPKDAMFHDNLCLALGMQGKLDEALAEHRIAIRIQPNFANAHNTLGHILSDFKGDYRAAVAEFREAVRLQPDFAVYHDNLAVALSKQQDLDGAIVEYRIAIRLQPDLVGAHMGLGEIFEFQGKRDDAIVEFRTASRVQTNFGEAHHRLAWTLVKKPDCSVQERNDALEHAQRAVVLGPNDPYYRTTLALAEYRAGHWAESITAAQRSIVMTKEVDSSANWFILALAHWHKPDKDEARRWFDQAVAWTKEKDPTNADLRQFWAESAGLMGQPGPDPPREDKKP